MKQIRKNLLVLVVLLLWGQVFACIPQINWGSSISFCQGNTFTLSAYNANSSYLWSTGATSSSIVISSSGSYWVKVTNACGSATDTIQVSVDQPMSINLGADRKICATTPTTLSVPFSSSATYLWSTGATGNSISVNQTGTFYVVASNACGIFTDTVSLTVENPPGNLLGADINQCSNIPVNLSIPPGTTGQILWSDGSHGNGITIATSGAYWVRLANACGIFSDTIQVNFLIQNQLFQHDTIALCAGGSLVLQPTVPGSSYSWSTGASSPSISVTQPGLVWLGLNTACGMIYDSVYFQSAPTAMVDLGSDTLICASDNLVLDAGNSGSVFNWSTGAKTQSISVNKSGTYWVGVDNGCGFVYDSIQVTANPFPRPAIDDTVYVCAGSLSQILNAGNWGSNTQYLWSNGSQTQTAGNFPVGSHWVQITNVCDTITKNFYVQSVALPSFDLGPDTTTCESRVLLSTGLTPHSHDFTWSNGSKSHRLSARNTGYYWVTVTNACGSTTDSIFVTINNLPSSISDDTISKCSGSSKLILLPFIQGTSYEWSTGDTTNYTMAALEGPYWVRAYHQCDTLKDTVYVEDVFPSNIDLGPDTLICLPDQLIFDWSHLKADSIVWQGSKKSDAYNATLNGLHWVEVYNACGIYRDSIWVTVESLPKRLLKDTSYCYNSAVDLDVFQPNVNSYLWNTGDTSASISVNQTGWYYVDMQNECGIVRDSADVRIDYNLPNIDLGSDTLFCGGTLQLDAGEVTGAYYLWQNGQTSRTFDVTKTGQYYVNVYNACNSASDTINVIVTGPPAITLGNNVKFCRGSVLNLNAQNPGSTYLWNTGDTAQSISIGDPGVYWVNITNDCGSVTDSINVIVEDPLNTLQIGRDTSICRGDSILLDTRLSGVSTKWQNGATTASIYVHETGDYWVEVSNSCGTWEDTIHVEVVDIPEFSLGPDTVICMTGNGIDLIGPPGLTSYQWNTGATSSSLRITQPGTYWLTVSNTCFSYTDTIMVRENYPLAIDLGSDTVLCEGETLLLQLNVSDANITWIDQSGAQSMEVTETGQYFVEVENACGSFTDTIIVQFDQYLSLQPEELVVCRDDSISVNLADLKASFEWFDGSVAELRYFDEEGDYPLIVTNRCGTFIKDYSVRVTNCDCPFFIPNAFTPNQDGLNEEFMVGHSCDLTDFKLQIFNRWGNRVFESFNADIGWDGSFNAEPMPAGIYTYSISYSWEVYGTPYYRTKTGKLTLVR